MRSTLSCLRPGPRVGLIAALVLGIALRPAAAGAQSPEADVLAVVKKLFDGMRARDSLAIRALFDADGRLVDIDTRSTPHVVKFTAPAEFASIVGKATGPVWDERVIDPEVRIDGNIAQVWTKYEFWLGDQFRHCGVDAFQLAKVGTDWKILQLADTRRREGCGRAPAGR